jgi:hypothetical protein
VVLKRYPYLPSVLESWRERERQPAERRKRREGV